MARLVRWHLPAVALNQMAPPVAPRLHEAVEWSSAVIDRLGLMHLVLGAPTASRPYEIVLAAAILRWWRASHWPQSRLNIPSQDQEAQSNTALPLFHSSHTHPFTSSPLVPLPGTLHPLASSETRTRDILRHVRSFARLVTRPLTAVETLPTPGAASCQRSPGIFLCRSAPIVEHSVSPLLQAVPPLSASSFPTLSG